VTTGSQHSCAVREGGEVECFGANDVGQLGVSGMPESTTPVEVELPEPASFVITEVNTTCALLADRRLFCWGENTEGQLGLSDGYPGENYFEPIEVGSLEPSSTALYRAVDVGHGHVCGIRDSGALYCWGRNTAEQLGLGLDAPDQVREPTRVGDSTGWRSVQAGADSSCVIDGAAALYCWGTNTFANLGTGDRETYELATPVAPEIAFSRVSIDTFHSCAVDQGGALYCWGRGNEGQLANGEWVDREVPTLVPGETFSSVAVGRFFTCAVHVDGAVFCSGSNDGGQLGQGDTERRSVLSLVAFE
jgi:alpha-tubulin suppressor-like RCC1 family protein